MTTRQELAEIIAACGDPDITQALRIELERLEVEEATTRITGPLRRTKAEPHTAQELIARYAAVMEASEQSVLCGELSAYAQDKALRAAVRLMRCGSINEPRLFREHREIYRLALHQRGFKVPDVAQIPELPTPF